MTENASAPRRTSGEAPASTPPADGGLHGPARTQLLIACAASFVVWSGFGAILPYLPIFLKDEARASVALIGVIAAAYYVGTFLSASPMGALSDRIGRKPLLVSGVALYAVSTALFMSTTHPGWFLLFRFLEGLAAGMVTPAAQAFIADITTEENRGRAYGWLTSAQFGGLVAGPAMAIPLYQLGGGEGIWAFYSIFLFGTALSAVTALALLLFLKEPERAHRHLREAAVRPPYRRLITKPIAAFLLVAFTGNFAMGNWEVLWSIWLQSLGASMSFIGLTWMAFSVPMLFSFLGGRLADRYNRFRLMFSGLTLSAISWIVYGLTRNLGVFLLFSVVEGVAIAWALPAKQSFLVQVSPQRWLGSVQGMESTSTQAAAFLGTLVSPLLYSVMSGYALAVGGFIALAGLAVAAPILGREWRRQTEERPGFGGETVKEGAG